MTVEELITILQDLRYPEAPVVFVFGTHGLQRPIERVDVMHAGGTRIHLVAGEPK